jgi:KipI family sensor histidine kinase inhibitor
MAAYQVVAAGDTALVVEFGDCVDPMISTKVLALARDLDALQLAGIVETVPTIRSLSVYFEPLSISAAALESRIKELVAKAQDAALPGQTWRIPVCYSPELAPDLSAVADRCKLTPAEVIELHSGALYHVYMLGFLPGLAYLGNLPETLALPRRATPRTKVPAGSVGIGGPMTCVYPMDTPCGWHVIGRSPALLWDASVERAALLSAGDKVKFEPVSLHDFELLRRNAKGAAVPLRSTH